MALDIFNLAKQLFPEDSDDDIRADIEEIRSTTPGITDEQIAETITKETPTAGGSPAAEMQPEVRDYMEKRAAPAAGDAAAVSAAPASGGGKDVGLIVSEALAGLGDAISRAHGGTGENLKGAFGAEAAAATEGREARKFGIDISKEQRAEREAAEKERMAKEAKDPNSAISAGYRAIVKAAVPSMNVESASAAVLEKTLPFLKDVFATEQNRLLREAIAKTGADQKSAEADAKKTAEDMKATEAKKSKEVPGFINSGAVEIEAVEARDLRKGVAEFSTFDKLTKEYEAFIEKYGTQEVTDRRVEGEMKAYAKRLQLIVKNLAQLGVLSASDVPFIEEQIPGPGMFKTSEGMKGALSASHSMAATGLRTALAARGYEPTPEMEQRLSGAAAVAEPGAGAPADADKAARRAARRAQLKQEIESLQKKITTGGAK